MTDELEIRPIVDADVAAVQALWEAVFPDRRAWNQPAAYLPRKRAQRDDLILVAGAPRASSGRWRSVTTASAGGSTISPSTPANGGTASAAR